MTRVIGVRFATDNYGCNYAAKVYHYFVTKEQAHQLDEDYKIEITHVVIHNGHSYTVAKIVNRDVKNYDSATKHIIQLVDGREHVREQRRAVRLAEVRRKIEVRAKQVREQTHYERTLADDPVGQELIRELRDLEAA